MKKVLCLIFIILITVQEYIQGFQFLFPSTTIIRITLRKCRELRCLDNVSKMSYCVNIRLLHHYQVRLGPGSGYGALNV